MKWLRLLGLVVGWIQILLYGIVLAAGAAGIAWVAWRQSPALTVLLIVFGAGLGAIAWWG